MMLVQTLSDDNQSKLQSNEQQIEQVNVVRSIVFHLKDASF